MALAPTLATAEACTKEGDRITCPSAVFERMRGELLALELEVAKASAAVSRCERGATSHRLASEALCGSLVREVAAPDPVDAWRPVVGVVALGLAGGGGACLAAEGCPGAVGWSALAVSLFVGMGGLSLIW